MNELNKCISLIIYLLYILVIYHVIENLNLLTFFIFVIIVPSLLFAFSSKFFMLNSWNKNLYSCISAAIYCLSTYIIMSLAISDTVVYEIIQNTNKLIENNKDIIIDNISFNFNISSFMMIFFLEFILIRFFVRR